MKPIPILHYILLGTNLRFLQDTRQGWTIHGEGYVLGNINAFLRRLDKLDLHVMQRASRELKDFREKVKVKEEGSGLSGKEASDLSRMMGEIRNTFEAETSGIFAYSITDKKLDVTKLLEGVDRLFNPSVFSKCSECAQYDFREAGVSIAFERATAAAFHILRGTEAVLRAYYKGHIRPAKKGMTWGGMTKALSEKQRGKKPDPVLLNQLDYIRATFRNPTQHPDKIYDIQEVQDLFSICIDAVNRMIGAITKKPKSKK
jgi:hypothetical protein